VLHKRICTKGYVNGHAASNQTDQAECAIQIICRRPLSLYFTTAVTSGRETQLGWSDLSGGLSRESFCSLTVRVSGYDCHAPYTRLGDVGIRLKVRFIVLGFLSSIGWEREVFMMTLRWQSQLFKSCCIFKPINSPCIFANTVPSPQAARDDRSGSVHHSLKTPPHSRSIDNTSSSMSSSCLSTSHFIQFPLVSHMFFKLTFPRPLTPARCTLT
jgi:hypothetical protein